MTRLVLVHELQGSELLQVHQIFVPSVGERDFYRQGLSFDAFSKHWKEVIYANHLKGKWHPEYWFSFPESNLLDANRLAKPVPLKVHHGVWSFYEDIDWDYKTKTFG